MTGSEPRGGASFPFHSKVSRGGEGPQAEEDKPQTPTFTEARRRCKQVALLIALLGVTFWTEFLGERRHRPLVRIPSVLKNALPKVHQSLTANDSVELENLTEEGAELGDVGDGFARSSANATETRGRDKEKHSNEVEQKLKNKARDDPSSESEVMEDEESPKPLTLESACVLVALFYALIGAKLHDMLLIDGEAKMHLSPRNTTTATSPGGSRTPTQLLTTLEPPEEIEEVQSPPSSPGFDVVDGPAWRFPAASEVELAVIPAALQGAGLPAVGGFLEHLITASSANLVSPADESEMESVIDGPSTQTRASRRSSKKKAGIRDKSAQVALLLALLGVRLFLEFMSGKTPPILKQVPAFFRKTLAHLPDPVAKVIKYAIGIKPPKKDVRAPRKRRTLPTPSFSKQKLRGHKKTLHRQQLLPSVEDADSQLSLSAQEGKKFLAQHVSLESHGSSRLSLSDRQAIAAVTSVLTGDAGGELIDQVIKVENVNPLQDARTDTPQSRSLKVRKFLGKGSTWAAFEVEDVETGEELALRVFLMPKLQLPTDETIELGKQALDLEERSARQVCGLMDSLVVAREKGIAVPVQTGELSGIPEVSSTGRFHVFSQVQLMELMEEDLGSLLERHEQVPVEAKEYIAQRLLLQVLHLQQAQVSHTDLKLENCLLRKDGSFLLGDFGYSTPWGECMHKLSRLTLAYAEPELLIDFRAFLLEDAEVTPHPKSDLWSLGAILFELFTDGDLPYGMMEAHNDIDGLCNIAKKLLDREASSDELEPALKQAEVPSRWRELILKLLEPQRTHRITGSEIVEKFPDLYGSLD